MTDLVDTFADTFADTLARLRAERGDVPLERAPEPTVSMVGVGWSVWEKSPDGTSYDPRGGVVVHVDPHSVPDPDTGELVDRFLVVRAGRHGLHWVSLRADQVAAVHDGNRPNAHTIRGVCQMVARELRTLFDGTGAGARRSPPDDDRALDLFSLGCRLMSVLARPGTVPPA